MLFNKSFTYFSVTRKKYIYDFGKYQYNNSVITKVLWRLLA